MNCTVEVEKVNSVSKPITRVWCYECENNSENATSNDLEGTDEHSYRQGSRTWNLTVNERELQGRSGNESVSGVSNVRTATLDDVHDLGCVGGDVGLRDYVIHVDEGFFVWDGQVGEYEPVDDLKDVVLSRMESLGLENSLIYENYMGMKNYAIHMDLDNREYGILLG